ncbi:MAG: hypothetical protein ACPGYT_09890 [Nitrospirales bacterium]
MSSISQAVSHIPIFQPISQSPTFTSSTDHLQARSQTLTNTSFSVVTAEGDRVSLSSGSAVNTSLDTYTFQGFSEGHALSFREKEFSTSIQQNFNLFVEGDLNEQEQADIQDFLKSANSIFQDLAAGNTKGATQTAASLGNLGTLSQAALFVRQSTTVSIATQSTRVVGQERTELNEASKREQSEPKPVDTLEQILEKIRDTQEQFKINPEKLVNRLPTLATTLMSSLEDDDESTDSAPSIFKQIQQEFLESLLQSTQTIQPSQDSNETPTDSTNTAERVPPINPEKQPNASSPQVEAPQISIVT